jgi:endonuclease/exonuclease/phosphatase family metal-dependent hydrolase
MWMGWRHCVLAALFGTAASSSAPAPRTLTIASWNLDWLVTQETAHTSRLACNAGRTSPVPCDVARELARDSADLARLAHYARQLDADVVAFQEVENAHAARRVFRGYDVCIGGGKGVQHPGFAVRSGIAHRCDPALQALALGSRQRAGALLTLYPGTAQQIELLAVHLKSGCSRDPLDSGSTACRTLAAQAAALGEWMTQRAAAHARSIVLGDFNRAGPDANDPFWQQLHAGTAADAAFFNVSAGTAFRNCYRGQPFTRYIDHILVSAGLAMRIVPGSFRRHGYRSLDALRYRLSDHCPSAFALPGTNNMSGLSSLTVATPQLRR